MAFLLTVDDGPSLDAEEKLAFLKDRGVRCVWFCVGQNLALRPESALALVRAGHVVANHSYNHPHFSEIDLPRAAREIAETERLIDDVYSRAGRPPTRLFRFPYGDQGDGETEKQTARRQHRDAINDFLHQRGYRQPPSDSVEYLDGFVNLPGDRDWLWSYDVEEWAIGYTSTYDAVETNLRRYLQTCDRDRTQIVLMHDHAHTTRYFTELVDIMLSKNVDFASP